jgi:tetratricopeptide (TPR) repeat protein
MTALLALIFLAVSVRQDQTPLRTSCDSGAETIANLPAGAEVTIRFALSGEATPCYKIVARVGGKELSGYVAASALQGLDAFDRGLRDAAWVDLTQVLSAVRPTSTGPRAGVAPRDAPRTAAAGLVDRAAELLESGQPEKALQLIEPAARSARDPGLLALAGAAAWRADDTGKALGYWRESLDLQPNPALESLYQRVEKENKNDQSSARLYGFRIALRYEAGAIGADTAREIVAVLDREFARISSELGCVAEERIVAIAQSPEAYRKTTDAAEWSGGQFDGRIRVPIAPEASGQSAAANATVRRTLAHEIAHACLTLTGQWPAWLQEGLAQRLSGDQVSPELRAKLAEWSAQGKLPKLANLGQDWSRLDTEHAIAAYGLSLEAIETFYASYGAEGVRNLLHNPDRLAAITADIERRLGL